MALDPVRNFAKSFLATGIDSSITTIVLNAGDGAKFPDPATSGAYNLTIWDRTAYSDPADDPNKEIVRVTARSTDTLTATRGQEGTTGSAHNTAGRSYGIVLSLTALQIANILATFAILAGVAGGQTLIGGTAITDILKLQGTTGAGTLTAAAIQALVGTAGGTIAMTILNNGNIGIGTTNPGAKLEVVGTIRNSHATDGYSELNVLANFGGQLNAYGYTGSSAAGNSPSASLGRARGTSASPTAVLSGDRLGIFGFRGTYDNSGTFRTSAGLSAIASENWSATAAGAGFGFEVQPNGGIASRITAMTIANSGNVGIGTANADAKIEILGSADMRTVGSSADSVLRVSNTYATNFNSGGEIQFGLGASNRKTLSVIKGLYTGYWEGNYGGSLAFYTQTHGDGSLNERMRISHYGDVGIGTTSPTNLLSLGGNAARKFWMERHTTANTTGNSLTIQAGGATAGATDKDGGMSVMSPGVSTGTGKASVRTQRLGRAASTATTDNALYDAILVASELNLVDGVATSLFEVALPTLTIGGGTIEYSIIATDGTDMQSLSGFVAFSAVNKGGVYTTQITENASNQSKAVSAGTLTGAWSILNGTDKVTIQLNADTSLTPTSFKLYYKVHNGSRQAITQL